MIGSELFPFLENMLSRTARRQESLAANIANLDTPGYRAKDVSFQDELRSGLQLASTSGKHLSTGSDTASTRVYEVETRVKSNGNSVDLDREMTEMTKNGLQYVTLVQYLNHKLRTLRSSLTEGGR